MWTFAHRRRPLLELLTRLHARPRGGPSWFCDRRGRQVDWMRLVCRWGRAGHCGGPAPRPWLERGISGPRPPSEGTRGRTCPAGGGLRDGYTLPEEEPGRVAEPQELLWDHLATPRGLQRPPAAPGTSLEGPGRRSGLGQSRTCSQSPRWLWRCPEVWWHVSPGTQFAQATSDKRLGARRTYSGLLPAAGQAPGGAQRF